MKVPVPATVCVLWMAVMQAQADLLVLEDQRQNLQDGSVVFSVDAWSGVAPGQAHLNGVRVEFRASLFSSIQAANTGATSTPVYLTGESSWLLSPLGGALGSAADAFDLNTLLGTLAPGEQTLFGPVIRDSGWVTLWEGATDPIPSGSAWSYELELQTLAGVLGGSNFASSLTTLGEAALRVTYDFDSGPAGAPPVPELPAAAFLLTAWIGGRLWKRRCPKGNGPRI